MESKIKSKVSFYNLQTQLITKKETGIWKLFLFSRRVNCQLLFPFFFREMERGGKWLFLMVLVNWGIFTVLRVTLFGNEFRFFSCLYLEADGLSV